mmetsp:Transcript_3905/g.6169  ORF Transcript_3905/g.6169 Transcript_3905/m.6169 type:complete len:158 (+) Transcript_3905:1847-2320(+)
MSSTQIEKVTDVHIGFRIGAELQRVTEEYGFQKWFVGSASRSESVKEVVEHFAEMIRENEKAGRESMWEGEEEEKTEPLNKSNCDDAVEGNSVLWPCESYCVLMRMPRWSTLILMPRTFWQQPPHNHHRAFSVVAEGGGGGAVQTLQRQTAEREKYS